jgi:hypothetical protein
LLEGRTERMATMGGYGAVGFRPRTRHEAL